MRKMFVLPLCAVLVCVSATAAEAQASDPSPFRAGQWGAEFTIGTSNLASSGVGVLKFSSERRALLLNLLGQVTSQSGDSLRNSSSTAATVQLGSRWYRPATRQVMQYATLGVLATASTSKSQPTGLPTGIVQPKASAIGGGVFADIGAAWFVTPHLSLGASWGAEATVTRRKDDVIVSGTSVALRPATTNNVAVRLGTLSLRTGLYF